MNKFWDFFVSERTSRWQLLLGGAFVVGLSFLQNEIDYQRTLSDTEAAAAQQRG